MKAAKPWNCPAHGPQAEGIVQGHFYRCPVPNCPLHMEMPVEADAVLFLVKRVQFRCPNHGPVGHAEMGPDIEPIEFCPECEKPLVARVIQETLH
jgi:hypothetical protein